MAEFNRLVSKHLARLNEVTSHPGMVLGKELKEQMSASPLPLKHVLLKLGIWPMSQLDLSVK